MKEKALKEVRKELDRGSFKREEFIYGMEKGFKIIKFPRRKERLRRKEKTN